MGAQISEKQIENKIKAYLKKLPSCFFYKHHATGFSKVGIPDIVCCIHGKFVGIEVKKPTGIQSDAQKVIEKQIVNSGGLYILCFSYEECIEKLEHFLK